MAKKQKKKRMKKYKQKYFTGGRVDYSKGGRVSLQEGGNLKYGDKKIIDGVEQEFTPVGWKPMQTNEPKQPVASTGVPDGPVAKAKERKTVPTSATITQYGEESNIPKTSVASHVADPNFIELKKDAPMQQREKPIQVPPADVKTAPTQKMDEPREGIYDGIVTGKHLF